MKHLTRDAGGLAAAAGAEGVLVLSEEEGDALLTDEALRQDGLQTNHQFL